MPELVTRGLFLLIPALFLLGCGASESAGHRESTGGTGALGGGSGAGAAGAGMGGGGSGPTGPWGIRQFGGETVDEGQDAATDGDGNVYLAGFTLASLDEATSSGSADVFLVKYTSAGVRQWTQQVGSPDSEEQARVATDGAGAVYVTGSTHGTIAGNASAGGYDWFLARYGSDGVRAWVRQYGSAGDEFPSGVAVDASGSVLVCGYTSGGLDGNTSAGRTDVFLVKYDPSGTPLWTRQIGSDQDEFATGVALDATGNIYVAGMTGGAFDGNPNAGENDAFLVKYDAAGTKIWSRQFGSAAVEGVAGVAAGASGSVVVAGFTNGAIDTLGNGGGKDVFLVEFSSDGRRGWSSQIGTPSDEAPLDVASDGAGSVYLTGYTEGAIDVPSAGGKDVIIAKHDASGQFLWLQHFGSSMDEYGNGITADGERALYAVGATRGALEGNANAGASDAFIVKYDVDGTPR